MNSSKVFFIVVTLYHFAGFAQVDEEAQREAERALQESKNYTYDANKTLTQNNFITAEAEYRKAISKSKENIAAPYNLGRAYYNRESYPEAFGRFKSAGEKASEKPDKHKAYHNLGNVFMKNKEYAKAVEAYKQALRANPNDDETRYNLALAKKMQEKEQNDQDQNNQDKKNDENKEDQNKNQDQNNEGDSDKKDEGEQNKEEGDKGDKGKENPEENKEGEGEEKQEEKQNPKNKSEEKDQEKNPRPNQLSKQQIQNLLEAMQNEEKKVQEKLNAQKVKGPKIKNEKDW